MLMKRPSRRERLQRLRRLRITRRKLRPYNMKARKQQRKERQLKPRMQTARLLTIKQSNQKRLLGMPNQNHLTLEPGDAHLDLNHPGMTSQEDPRVEVIMHQEAQDTMMEEGTKDKIKMVVDKMRMHQPKTLLLQPKLQSWKRMAGAQYLNPRKITVVVTQANVLLLLR